MIKTQPLKELQDRIELFRNSSGEFERKCTRTILENLPRFLVAVFGTVVESRDLARFYEPTGFELRDPDTALAEVLDLLSPEQFERLPLYREMVDLHGETLFGLIDVSDSIYDYHYTNLPSNAGVYIEEEIPQEWCKGTELSEIFEARRCRRMIDGETGYEGHSVSVAGLSRLVKMDIKTLRNILSRDGSGVHLIKSGPDKGRVEAHVAREWLKTRPEYLPTISLPVSTALNQGLLQPAVSEVGPFLFVPTAADGTTFSPSSTINGKYEIGAKAQDLSFTNYHEALLALQSLPDPAWKRTDKANRVRITTVTHWMRVPESSLHKGGQQ